VIVLADGRVIADATPDQVRTRGGAPVIRYRLPPGTRADDLPPLLAHRVDPARGELSLPSADLTADLGALVGWARTNRADLTGLEISPPSLEDAYLSLTADASQSPVMTPPPLMTEPAHSRKASTDG
jgi:ABC-2 type transport system ATP-binding protein